MQLVILITLALITSPILCPAEIIKIKLSDGDTLTGSLSLPDQKEVKGLVIFIPGTGPNTYDNYRKFGTYEFNFYDLFREQFNKRGIALFTYNRRGVETGEQPPYFDKINQEKFKKYLPETEALDIETIIHHLQKDKRLKKAAIILYGTSEGTMIAPIIADRKKARVDGLLLHGYANDNLSDIIQWQFSGAGSIIFYKRFFDTNDDNIFTQEEYSDTNKMATYGREKLFQQAPFNTLDKNNDGVISKEDFQLQSKPLYDKLLKAIPDDDDDFIWKNYFRVTSGWLKAHFALEPNKTRMLRLNIPIYIFHGDRDASAPLDGVYAIKNEFEQRHKTNLHVYVFHDHDHDLNYLDYIFKQQIPEGLLKIFETAEQLKKR